MGNEGQPVYCSSWAVSVCVRICGVFGESVVCADLGGDTVFSPSLTFTPACIHIRTLTHFSLLRLNMHRDAEVGGSVFVLVYMNELMSLFL